MAARLLQSARSVSAIGATVCTLLLLAGGFAGGPALAAPLDEAVPGAADGLSFRVLESDDGHTLVEVLFPRLDVRKIETQRGRFDALAMAGAGPIGEPGHPRLLVAGTMIAVPPSSGVELTVIESEFETLDQVRPLPVQEDQWSSDRPVHLDEAAYRRSGLWPDRPAEVSDPAIMRDFRVVSLRTFPVAYDAATGELRVARRLLLELDYSSQSTVNVKTTTRSPSRAFRSLYENVIANYDFVRSRYESDSRGKYLIVTHDNFYGSILPLAEWKHKRGMEVEIAKLSVIGSSASQIKSYIQTAYDTWTVPPDYVLIVGDSEYVPTSNMDNYYGQLEGGDALVDVFVGRFPAESVTECNLLVDKTLGYERTPYMSDLDWFRSGCLIVRQDYDEDDAIYFGDTWFAYGLWESEGFVQIDTLFSRNGSDKYDVYAAITDGRVLLNFRGQGVTNWYSPFDCDPNQTNPGYKLPVVMAATCASGNFTGDGYPCEAWLTAGTSASPKGSVASVGTSIVSTGVAGQRSAVNRGFNDALFNLKMHTLGEATAYGKARLLILYPEETYEYNGWNLQGDPDLDVWTAVPIEADITHPATVPNTPSDLSVHVENSGYPLQGALVCAYAPGEIYETGHTDINGDVTLSISPALAETVWVTVSGHNLHPYEGHAVIQASGPNLAFAGVTVADDSPGGDGNGALETGETAWLTLTLNNTGVVDLTGVVGVLSTSDDYAVVTDSVGGFGDIPVGGSAQSSEDGFRVSVSPVAPPGHMISFSVAASGDADTTRFEKEMSFSVTLGGSAADGPSGPDNYGYYAYDTGDVWTGQAPVYDWVELVGTGTIMSEITNQDAATTTIALPFTFQYYGANYTDISVCSNGFVALGTEDYRFGDNSAIPEIHGPEGMIAPFWDDLNPAEGGDIYQWYDSANHRWICQFDAVQHYGGGNAETFEVILLDPAHYPTASGDGEIILQYQTVAFPYSMTVGIENPAETTGIQYLYNSTYDPAAAPISSGQAIKFTTEPPASPPVWLVVVGSSVDDSAGGDGDGQAEPREQIELTVTLENLGTSSASEVTGTLTTSDPDVVVDDGSASFGTIGAGLTGDNAGSPFVISIGDNPSDEIVELDLQLSTGMRYDTYDVLTIVLDLSQTGVDDGYAQLVFALGQNSPNPFNSRTAVAFELPAPSHATLTVYNVAGRKVATLLDDECPAGRHSVIWDGREESGRKASAGIYFYMLDADQGRIAKKLMVLK